MKLVSYNDFAICLLLSLLSLSYPIQRKKATQTINDSLSYANHDDTFSTHATILGVIFLDKFLHNFIYFNCNQSTNESTRHS